uniref:Protein XRI1 n=1 Tax=Leersia perrieri TaxID=77586 RepID=A0A0D9X8Q4_9ORYZ
METAQEREMHAWRWPLDTMACSLRDSSRFLFEWVPHFRYFGVGVVGVGAASDPHGHNPHGHELGLEFFFPKCMESPAMEATAAVTSLPAPQDTGVMYEEFDELLQNFWDCNEEQLVSFGSSSFLKENSDVTCFPDNDGDDLPLGLNSASPIGPPDNTVGLLQGDYEQQPHSSASSHCNVGPHASDTGTSADKNCSSKRPVTPEGTETASSKKSRTMPAAQYGSSVLYPFAVVKPSGLDGGMTLADINARILTRPPRPVRHPVGEFACAPRAAAGNRPAPSGKTVAGFTRLHTAGRGTITIIRTTG